MFFFLHTCEAKAEVCFDKEIAGRMVTEIEGCRIMTEEQEIMKGIIDSLNSQISIIEEKEKLIQESLDKAQKIIDEKDKECSKKIKEEVKKVKPSFFQELGKAAGFAVIGIIVGILL